MLFESQWVKQNIRIGACIEVVVWGGFEVEEVDFGEKNFREMGLRGRITGSKKQAKNLQKPVREPLPNWDHRDVL